MRRPQRRDVALLDSVLKTQLREQAGSDSYNRFEYQVGWVVNRVFEKLEQDDFGFLLLCEFHDDVAEAEDVTEPKCLRFYQVKTNAKDRHWTLTRLLERKGARHSFLGFMFYNYLTFGDECMSCVFTSNLGFNTEICAWQADVQDGKELERSNPDLHLKLFDAIRTEFHNIDESTFQLAFRRFIQCTVLVECDIPLKDHDNSIKGRSLGIISRKFDVNVGTAYKVMQEIWSEVRKKTKTKISTPISMSELVRRRGITGDVLRDLRSGLATTNKQNFEELIRVRFPSQPAYVAQLIRAIRSYHVKRLDVADHNYQDLTASFLDLCDHLINNCLQHLDDIPYMENEAQQLVLAFSRATSDNHPMINELHLKGIFYDRLLGY